MATAAAHFDKHQCPFGIAHDEVNLTTAAPGRSIIALYQTQARGLQTMQRPVFTGLAQPPRGGKLFCKETH